MKKKILALCVVISLAAVAIIGGTLAYFTDTETATNVFTTGDVKIDLIEEFDSENAKLMPGIDIKKEVTVKNTGSEDAYVRVHIAIPSMLDSGSEDQPQFAAYNNTLHWNFNKESLADGQWNWHKTNVDGNSSYGPGYPENGGAWNMYQQEIDGILYNVYVATYESILGSEVTTATTAINKVYLDKEVTNEQMTEIINVLGETPKILVAAEGGQKAGFEEAYEALNTQFGVPGTYDVEWTAVVPAQ